MAYKAFRTGFTYREIFEMLWSWDPDTTTWKYKGRNIVLGKWHQIKKEHWANHVEFCGKEEPCPF